LPIDVVTVDINRLQEHVDMDVEKEVSVVGEDWIEREETGEKERTGTKLFGTQFSFVMSLFLVEVHRI
jgi:hypothetical protein